MEQSELDKNEEQAVSSSSVELSESEAAGTPEAMEEPMATEVDVTDEQTTVDEAEPQPAQSSPAEEDAAAASIEDEQDDASAADDSEAESTEDSNGLKRGDLIEGTVAETSPTLLRIDLGEGRIGVVPGRELETMPSKMLESLAVGDSITVYVVNPRNHRGETILSVNHALEELDWTEAETYFDNKEVYDARIGGYNKGGLIVRFGRLRGFVPQSQISETRLRRMKGSTPEERYGGLVNEPISVKVMEVDRGRNRLILSERAAMREVRQRRKETLINELQVGEIREGIVVSLENFGAFVDVGGAEGLVHLTEISHKHVTHPRHALEVGQEVQVEVISVDPDQNRIGLSMRKLEPDPWDEIATQYSVGQVVEGRITKLTKFGAFARLVENPEVEGLIHISELSEDRVEHPKDEVKKDEKLALRIVKIDVKNRRLGLSLKRVNSAEYLDQDLDAGFQHAEENPPEPQAAAPAEPEAAAEDTLADKVEDVVDAVEDKVEDVVDAIEDKVEDVVDAIEDFVEDALNKTQETAEDSVEKAQDALDDDDKD